MIVKQYKHKCYCLKSGYSWIKCLKKIYIYAMPKQFLSLFGKCADLDHLRNRTINSEPAHFANIISEAYGLADANITVADRTVLLFSVRINLQSFFSDVKPK